MSRTGFQYSSVISRSCWVSVQWRDVADVPHHLLGLAVPLDQHGAAHGEDSPRCRLSGCAR